MKQLYEDLFDLLQGEPHYLARLASRANTVDIPALTQVPPHCKQQLQSKEQFCA
jgi:hypothetical protein